MRINNCSVWSLENRLMFSRWMLESREQCLMNLGWSYRTSEPTWHWFWQKTNNERALNVRRWCKKDRFCLMCPVWKCLPSFHFSNWPCFHRNSSNKCVNSWFEIEYCTHLKHFYPSVHLCIIYSTNLTVSHHDLFTHLKSANWVVLSELSMRRFEDRFDTWKIFEANYCCQPRLQNKDTTLSFLGCSISICKCIYIYFSWRVLDCVTKGLIIYKSDSTAIHLTFQVEMFALVACGRCSNRSHFCAA